jgi:hypothetical protein
VSNEVEVFDEKIGILEIDEQSNVNSNAQPQGEFAQRLVELRGGYVVYQTTGYHTENKNRSTPAVKQQTGCHYPCVLEF